MEDLAINCMVCRRKIEISTQLSPITTASQQNPDTAELPLICAACKKFYWRYRRGDLGSLGNCSCRFPAERQAEGQPSSSSSPASIDGMLCRACRFARCEVALSRLQTDLNDQNGGAATTTVRKETTKRTNLQMVPCQVCGASSSGYHFGIISCEGCKGFFRRSLSIARKNRYKCALESPSNSSNKQHDKLKCKKCRYDACLVAGMSDTNVRTGRHSIQRRIQTTLFVRQLAAENRLLSSKTFRRDRRSSDDQLELASDSSQPRRRLIFSSVLKFMRYLATPSPERSLEERLEFQIGDKPFCVDSIVQASVRAMGFLAPLSQMRADPLRPDMAPELIWDTYLKTSFQPHINCVLSCIRALPGFTDVAIPDRIKLFSHAYFPILLAQLSLNYDGSPSSVNFLSLPDETSIQIVKRFFRDEKDLCHKQLIDSGVAMLTMKPSLTEFAMLCGLLFFNPSIKGLADADKVAKLKHAYEFTDVQVNSVKHCTELVAPAPITGHRFTHLLGYFQPMVRLFAQALNNVEAERPQLLSGHPLFSELYSHVSSESE